MCPAARRPPVKNNVIANQGPTSLAWQSAPYAPFLHSLVGADAPVRPMGICNILQGGAHVPR